MNWPFPATITIVMLIPSKKSKIKRSNQYLIPSPIPELQFLNIKLKVVLASKRFLKVSNV
jgi:hypothetical protein